MMMKPQTLAPTLFSTSAFISWKFVLLFFPLALLKAPTITGLDRAQTANERQPLKQMVQPQKGNVMVQEVDIRHRRVIRETHPQTKVIRADFLQQYNHEVSKASPTLYIYNYKETNATTPVRISVIGNDTATDEYPVLFVARQQEGILSWKIPLRIVTGLAKVTTFHSYLSASRTLCPVNEKHEQELSKDHTVFLDVSTMSETSLSFTLKAELLTNFELEHNKPRTEVVAASRPVYYRYTFPEGIDNVLLTVASSDKVCMTVSIQRIKCPVMDLEYNIEYLGKYQTMSTRAALYLQRKNFQDFNGFYVVFVVKPNNYDCTEEEEDSLATVQERSKSITLEIRETITVEQYVIATLVTVFVFLGFYAAAGVIAVLDLCGCKKCKTSADPTRDERANTEPREPATEAVPTGSQVNSSSSMNETEFRPDSEEDKDRIWTKIDFCVSDLSRKNYYGQEKKYNLYIWNILIIAIFYSIPAVQLIITYHESLNESGNEDLCYYNFECAHPVKDHLTSFNNVFSNIGYVMLGLLFILIVLWKHRRHNLELSQHAHLEILHGIPQFFGLYYAMGISLVMEGIMSASYHVCPSRKNYQFDTSFMYIIACLSMLRIYQTRHPDISNQAHKVYLSLAFIILLVVFGVIYNTTAFWIVYVFVHIFFAFVITAEIYYVGRWRIRRNFFKQAWLYIKGIFSSCATPTYMHRFVLLLIANTINWGLTLFGAIRQPSDFASFLLGIFIGNMLVYCIYYIVMKLLKKESINPFVIVVFLTSLATWGVSIYFFTRSLTAWQDTPAKSREGNKECILLSFYDAHDVWHMLSAMSLFFSFLILFMLDGDLEQKKRDSIPVF